MLVFVLLVFFVMLVFVLLVFFVMLVFVLLVFSYACICTFSFFLCLYLYF